MPLCFCIAGELSKLETRVQEDGRVRLLPSFLNSGMTECVVKEELAPHAFPLIGIKFLRSLIRALARRPPEACRLTLESRDWQATLNNPTLESQATASGGRRPAVVLGSAGASPH